MLFRFPINSVGRSRSPIRVSLIANPESSGVALLVRIRFQPSFRKAGELPYSFCHRVKPDNRGIISAYRSVTVFRAIREILASHFCSAFRSLADKKPLDAPRRLVKGFHGDFSKILDRSS